MLNCGFFFLFLSNFHGQISLGADSFSKKKKRGIALVKIFMDKSHWERIALVKKKRGG